MNIGEAPVVPAHSCVLPLVPCFSLLSQLSGVATARMVAEARAFSARWYQERILARNGGERCMEVMLGHTGGQGLWWSRRQVARELVRKLACAIARQVAREDHATEQAREHAQRCESQSMHGSARTCRTSDP